MGESDFLSIVLRSHIFKSGCRTVSSSYNLTKSAPKDEYNKVWTHPKGYQDSLLLHHMCDSPRNMDNPCSDWFERFVEDVNPAIYIRNKDTH